MKNLPLLGLCLVAWNASPQTNQGAFHPEWFAPPQLTLRLPVSEVNPILPLPEFKPQSVVQPVEPQTSEPFLSDRPTTLAEELHASGRFRDFDLQIYARLEKQGCFTKVERSDSRIERFVENTFTPEVMHFRKVSVSCSLVTAVKRKNPFCLLNPYVLQLSW